MRIAPLLFFVVSILIAGLLSSAASAKGDDSGEAGYYPDFSFTQQLIVTKCDQQNKIYSVRNFEFGYGLVTPEVIKIFKEEFGKQYEFYIYKDKTEFTGSCDIGKEVLAKFSFIGAEEQNKHYGFLNLAYAGFPILTHESILNEGKYLYRFDYIRIASQEFYAEFSDHGEFPECKQYRLSLSQANLNQIKEFSKGDVNADLPNSKELQGIYNGKVVACDKNRNSADEDIYVDLTKLIEDIAYAD